MSKAKEKNMMRRTFFLAAGIAIFWIFIHLGGEEGLDKLLRLRLLPMAGALLATIAITGTIATRWAMLANATAGKSVASWLDFYHYFIIGRILGFILPKDFSDFFSRTASLNRLHGIPLARSAMSVVLDRFGDVLSIAVFLPASLPYWLGWVPAGGGIIIMLFTAVVGGVLVFAMHDQLVGAAVALFIKALDLSARFIPWLQNRSFEPPDIAGLDRDTAVKFYLLSVLKFCCTAVRFILFGSALNLHISPIVYILGTPLSQLSYLVAFTPGGLGVFEAGWYAILRFSGVDSVQASIFVVGQRILTMLLIAFLTAISQVAFTLKNLRRSSV